MGLFEQYSWFVYFGQSAGLISYHMKSDSSCSKKFVFSWCHPLTWWFTLSSALKLMSLVATILMFKFIGELSSIISTFPKAIVVLFCISSVDHYTMLVISHGTMLRYPHLRSAIGSITAKPITELEDIINYFPNYKNTIKKRTLIGIFLILTSMAISFILQLSSLYRILTGFTETVLGIVYLCAYVYTNIANDCFLLMFHLSYYSIAYYIRLLRAKLISNNKLDSRSSLKRSKLILTHLHETSTALASLFSVPVLYIITTKLIVIALNLFAIIYGLVKPSSTFLSSWMIDMSRYLITGLIHLWILLDAADMPVYQVRYFREQIISNANSHLKRGIDEHLEVMSLLQHVDEDRFRLSAAGLFHVGMHLLPTVTGSIVTYLVILLQYQFNT